MMSVEDRLKAAAQHKAAGDRQSAASLYEAVLFMAPGHAAALRALAEIRLEEGNFEAGGQFLQEALARDPADCDARVLMALLLQAQGNHRHAKHMIEETRILDPLHSEACALHADMLTRSGHLEQAEELLRTAIEARPDDAVLLSALAGLYAQVKHSAAALELAQKAVANAPEAPRHLARLGCILSQTGNHDKALPYLEKAHLKLPADPIIMLHLAECQAATGLMGEARMLAKRLTLQFPDLLASWILLLRIETYLGEDGKTFADFLQCVKQHKNKSSALVALATAYRQRGDVQKTMQLLRPLVDAAATLDRNHRNQVLALFRECALASDALETLALAPMDDQAQHKPTGGEDSDDNRLPSDVDKLFQSETADLFIEPGLTSLETLVLLRFGLRTPTGECRNQVFTPTYLAPLAKLFGDCRFLGTDTRDWARAIENPDNVIPLSAALSIAPDNLRSLRNKGPYIVPPADRRNTWRASLAALPRPIVALAWNASRPGLLLDDYRPLLENGPGFSGTFVSVMWDDARPQLASWPDIIDAGRHFQSLADLAALLAEADLLIGPDGLPVHVAGAMERPTVVLTQPAHPWYWHAQDGWATWYPFARVLKSERFGQWTSLVEDVRDPLLSMIDEHAAKQQELISG